MDSLISTFHLDLKLMIAQVINFAIVFVVLYIFALKPLKKLMDERGKTIAGGLENAELQKRLLAEFQEKVKKEQADLDKSLLDQQKEFKKELEVMRIESNEKTKEINQKMMDDARKSMTAEKDRIMDEAGKEIGKLVLAIAEKTLGDAMDEKLKAKIISGNIKDIK